MPRGVKNERRNDEINNSELKCSSAWNVREIIDQEKFIKII